MNVTNIEKVKEFMQTSNQYVSRHIRIAKNNRPLIKLRNSLLLEEINELITAINENNEVEILDALCDIEYIILGTALTYGCTKTDLKHQFVYNKHTNVKNISFIAEELNNVLKNEQCGSVINKIIDFLNCLNSITHILGYEKVVQEAFDRVHISNMSKFCTTAEETYATIEKYARDNITIVCIVHKELYVIHRESDNKVLKGINYKKVDLSDLV